MTTAHRCGKIQMCIRDSVKTIINQLHDRLQDEGISEDLIKHVADRLGHDRRYGIDPTKIKNDLGWYPETRCV